MRRLAIVLAESFLMGLAWSLGSQAVGIERGEPDKEPETSHTMPCPICEGTAVVRMRAEKP